MNLAELLPPNSTILIALYGAGLSTFTIVQTFFKNRRSLKVTIETYTPSESFPKIKHGGLEVVNSGYRAIKVYAPRLELPNRKLISPDEQIGFENFPVLLEEGDVARITFSHINLCKKLVELGVGRKVRIRPICKDTVGKTYKGQWNTYDLSKLIDEA